MSWREYQRPGAWAERARVAREAEREHRWWMAIHANFPHPVQSHPWNDELVRTLPRKDETR